MNCPSILGANLQLIDIQCFIFAFIHAETKLAEEKISLAFLSLGVRDYWSQTATPAIRVQGHTSLEPVLF